MTVLGQLSDTFAVTTHFGGYGATCSHVLFLPNKVLAGVEFRVGRRSRRQAKTHLPRLIKNRSIIENYSNRCIPSGIGQPPGSFHLATDD